MPQSWARNEGEGHKKKLFRNASANFNLNTDFDQGRMDGTLTTELGITYEMDYTLPKYQKCQLEAQVKSFINDLEKSGSDDTTMTLGVSLKVTNEVTLRANYIQDFNLRSGGEEDILRISSCSRLKAPLPAALLGVEHLFWQTPHHDPRDGWRQSRLY